MSSRQDRQGARTPADLERKYNFGENFHEIKESIKQQNIQLEKQSQLFSDYVEINDKAMQGLAESYDKLLAMVKELEGTLKNVDGKFTEKVNDFDAKLTDTTYNMSKAKAGFIYPFAGGTVPDGFLLCNGSSYSRTAYPKLFAAIGTTWGAGNGTTTFNVPNLAQRVPVGTGTGYALGATGGEATHTLTVNEMPSHNHVYTLAYGSLEGGSGHAEWTSGAHQEWTTQATGGSQPHNNMQPYTVVNYIIATGETPEILSDAVERIKAGFMLVLGDSVAASLRGLTIYGKTIQNGTPSPDSPMPLESAGNKGTIVVSVDSQNLAVSTPNGLPGIPVTSGGNYTDGSGQQWICDEVDFGKGVYVQRIYKVAGDKFNFAVADSTGYPVGNSKMFRSIIPAPAYDYGTSLNRPLLSNKVPFTNEVLSKEKNGAYIYGGGLYCRIQGVSDLTSFNALFATADTVVYVPLASPIETALSAEQLASFAVLHTNSPNTTISNDAGAWMEVTYTSRNN